jgi:signal transduction histidine kinase
MNTRYLKRLTIILPSALLILIAVVRVFFFNQAINWVFEGFVLILLLIGTIFFSQWVFRLIEIREQEIRRSTVQLAALNEAALILTQELDLGAVLQKVVDLACELVHAKFGALGVLDEEGRHIDQFITSGISPEDRRKMSSLPMGAGLLGQVIREGKPIRVTNIASDQRAVGFPTEHPPMNSFLGVPIKYKGRILGNLYLTDKKPPKGISRDDYLPFSKVDQQILEMFATQAGIAIDNARLYRKTQQLAIFQERERIGMNLHDGIIQSIYGIGLMLEDTQLLIESKPEVADQRIQRTISGLNEVIRDIRNYILDLRPERFKGRNLKSGLEELAREFRANTLLKVELNTDSIDSSSLSAEQTVEILHIVQEALTNVRKHARASVVEVDLGIEENVLKVMVTDNGIGIKRNVATLMRGNGLQNMRERALSLQGEISLTSGENSGTKLELTVPINNDFQS